MQDHLDFHCLHICYIQNVMRWFMRFSETTITVDSKVNRLNKWRKIAEIQKVHITVNNNTEEITRSYFHYQVCLYLHIYRYK